MKIPTFLNPEFPDVHILPCSSFLHSCSLLLSLTSSMFPSPYPYFLNSFGVSCRRGFPLPLNTSECISQNQGLPFHSHTTNSQIGKITQMQHCDLIRRPYSCSSSCPANVLLQQRNPLVVVHCHCLLLSFNLENVGGAF